MKKNLVEVAREEMAFYGAGDTSLQNLLMIVLGSNDAEATGSLSALGVRRLSKMTERDFTQFKGVGKAAAYRLAAVFGIANHLIESKKEDTWTVRSPEDAARCFENLYLKEQEEFVVVYLNSKNEVISRKTLFRGSLNASILHPRDVMREALKVNAASVICAHNHPSGNPDPSREDIEVTKRLKECGELMGIFVLDHIIMGDHKFVSLKEKGYL